jgi:hypothetical protein
MKKLFYLLIASFALITSVDAQTRTKTTANVNQGQYLDFGGINMVTSDSLQVTDSIAYIIPITHENDINAYHIFKWKKSGAGTATVTVNYFQGNDPTNLFAVPKGVAQSAYTKTFTLSTDSVVQINPTIDTATISGKYLKVQFFTSGTANVKGYIANRIKTNVK